MTYDKKVFVAHANVSKMLVFTAPAMLFLSMSGLALLLLAISLLLPKPELPEAGFFITAAVIFLCCLPICTLQINNYLSYFRNAKPALVMDDAGLDFAWYGLISWDQISAIHLQRQSGTRLGDFDKLELTVRLPNRYRGTMPWVRLKKFKRDDSIGIVDIDLYMLDKTSEEIHVAALELFSRSGPHH